MASQSIQSHRLHTIGLRDAADRYINGPRFFRFHPRRPSPAGRDEWEGSGEASPSSTGAVPSHYHQRHGVDATASHKPLRPSCSQAYDLRSPQRPHLLFLGTPSPAEHVTIGLLICLLDLLSVLSPFSLPMHALNCMYRSYMYIPGVVLIYSYIMNLPFCCNATVSSHKILCCSFCQKNPQSMWCLFVKINNVYDENRSRLSENKTG
jgi:hypothetical protein